MKKLVVGSLALLAFVTTSPVMADGIAVGVNGSTLGAGLTLSKRFTDHQSVRLGFNTFDYSFDETVDSIDYDMNFNLSSIGLFADYHPFGGGLRLSAGLVSNDNNIGANGSINSSVDIGNNTTVDGGNISADVTWDDLTPYLGFGFGNAVGKGNKLTFTMDVGVLLQSSAKVDLDVSNVTSGGISVAVPEDDIQAEEKSIQDSLNEFDVFPVIGVGLNYQF